MADNINDDTLDNPLNPQSENLSEENISTDTSDLVITNQETKKMEIHAQELHKAPGNGLKHYLFEFLMLFLAVFCGFLAENQREHMGEHKREKQYMISLIEDLETDTTQLKKVISNTESIARYADSTVLFFSSYTPANEVSSRLGIFIQKGAAMISVINTDRTSSQLKNSGAMRLVRKKNVADAILGYWKQIEETNIAIKRYLIYREAGREILFKLWVIPSVYATNLGVKEDSVQKLRVIDPDPKKWDELTNLISIGGSMCQNRIPFNLNKQNELATNLISLIKKEYHLN